MNVSLTLAIRVSLALLVVDLISLASTLSNWPGLRDASLIEILLLALPHLCPLFVYLVLRGKKQTGSLRLATLDVGRGKRTWLAALNVLSLLIWLNVLARLSPLHSFMSLVGTVVGLLNLAYSAFTAYVAFTLDRDRSRIPNIPTKAEE